MDIAIMDRQQWAEQAKEGSRLQHLVSIEHVDESNLFLLFDLAKRYKMHGPSGVELRGKILALLFYEPSTRTRLSFSSAMQRLGGGVVGFDAPESASVTKGESLLDTIRVAEAFSDGIVLRHPAEGSAALAADICRVPIINGGDGGHQHPTQTLYDLFTIWERHGTLRGLRVGMVGDLLQGRTTHSLSLSLARLGNHLTWIAPAHLQMPDYIVRKVQATGVHADRTEDLRAAIPSLDVLYVTRLQVERWGPAERAAESPRYQVTIDLLRSSAHHLSILHPLPRTEEIAYDVDRDPRAGYFQQVANAVPVRMAILTTLLGGDCL